MEYLLYGKRVSADLVVDYVEQKRVELRDQYPRVAAKLDFATDLLTNATGSEDYQHIGLICRDALILFAEELYSEDFVPPGEQPPKQHSVVKRIEFTLQHYGALAGSTELRDLVKKVWTYAVRLQHDLDPLVDDAHRTVLYTTLAIADLAELMEVATTNDEMMQTYGMYKCRACGSTDLKASHEADDFDEGGTVTGAHEVLYCAACKVDLAVISYPGGTLHKL